MNRYAQVASIGICLASLLGNPGAARAQQTPVTAIDIALEPDATMVHHAEAVNARLRSVFPKGFSLDATHHPHISMLQRYVRTADLDKIYAAADKVFISYNVTSFKLKAYKYYYLTDPSLPGLGLSGIVVETTPKLIKLQQDLIDAVAPYTVATGTAAAFVTTPAAPDINEATIHYIEVYVPEHSGEHLELHVTTGLASVDYLNKMLAEPFEDFTFSPSGASVFHLGNYGTAAAKLKELDVK
jgi:hypothetical protein